MRLRLKSVGEEIMKNEDAAQRSKLKLKIETYGVTYGVV